MDLKLHNKKVLVCSGDTDLGAACVIEFLKEGSQVVTTVLSQVKIYELFKRFHFDSATLDLTIIKSDITKKKDRIKLKPQIKSTEILINHSPGPLAGNFLEWNEEDWLGALHANLLSNIQIMNAVIPEMKRRKSGKILNISS